MACLSVSLRLLATCAALTVFLVGCTERRRGSGGVAPAGAIATTVQRGQKPAAAAPLASSPDLAPQAGTNQAPPPAVDSSRPLTKRFHLGPIDDVGPAGPMSATPRGVLFISREYRLYQAPRVGKEGFVPLQAPRELFSRYGRGPALSKEHAYFVSNQGELCRGHVDTGEVESLVRGARPGARVSVIHTAGRDLVGYIAGQEDEALGFVWAEGTRFGAAEVVRLTPEGAAATSITLVPTSPHPHAVLLEGRTGMSPVHLRRLLVTARRVTTEADEVVWVGPGSHPLTELVSLPAGGGQVLSLVATAKDVTHFGLAQLRLDPEANGPVEPTWRPYPNGLDPAPVAATRFCGGDFAVYAIPQHEKPHAPQDLVLAPIVHGQLGPEEVLAHSRAYNDISVAEVDGGALLAWTADHRTWAMVIGCDRGN
jgi:hypothetical protein